MLCSRCTQKPSAQQAGDFQSDHGSTPLANLPIQKGLISLPSSPAQRCSKHDFFPIAEMTYSRSIRKSESIRKLDCSRRSCFVQAPIEVSEFGQLGPYVGAIANHCHAEELVHVCAIVTCLHISGHLGFALTSIHIHVSNLPWSI